MDFNLVSPFAPAGDQPQAIEALVDGIERGQKAQVLLGVTGSGKTFTMANVIQQIKLPTLSPVFNNQSALSQTARTPGPLSTSQPVFTFDTRLYDATTLQPKAFVARSVLSSNYQVQLTARYAF